MLWFPVQRNSKATIQLLNRRIWNTYDKITCCQYKLEKKAVMFNFKEGYQ